MPLLAVVAFQGDRLAFALIMAADAQHQRVDAIVVGAEQAHFPAREAFEQPPEGPISVLHKCAGWRKGRPVSMLRISPSCRTNTMLTVATTFRGRSDG
jgi:hypothetical protein